MRCFAGEIIVALLAAGCLPAQVVVWEFRGPPVSEWTGWSMAAGQDIDGDGIPDVVNGAWDDATNSAEAGAVRAYSGAGGRPIAAWFGDDPGERFGFSVDIAGDVDGDGCADVIVGAYAADRGAPDTGDATVFSGATRARLWRFHGGMFDRTGQKVCGGGDVNADGFADFVISSPGAHGGSGRVDVRSGRDGCLLHAFAGSAAGLEFGHAVAGVGDVDGDRFDDIAVGSTAGFGRVEVFSGRSGALLWSAVGTETGAEFGYSIAGAGDVDGDGHADVLVGEPSAGGSAQAGAVHLLSGANGRRIFDLHHPIYWYAGSGHSVAAAGDVDADGVPDLMAGSRGGSAGVFSGVDGRVLFRAPSIGNGHANASVAGLGDLDGDGRAEVAVARTGTYAGVELHVLSSEEWVADEIHRSDFRISPAGDLDGDRVDELFEFDSFAGRLDVRDPRVDRA